MKNKNNASTRNRSFRRLVKKWFSSLIKRQTGDYLKNFERVMGRLQDIEDSIEIIAREITRQVKRGE